MNNKHCRFVDEYLIDQNATRAAIAVGYSPKTAKSQGSRLLTNADIAHAIEQGQNRISKELQITAQDKRAVLWNIATFNSQTIEDQHGKQRMRDPKAATSAIAELNKMDGTYRQNESNQTHVTFIQHFGDADDDRTVLTVMPPDD